MKDIIPTTVIINFEKISLQAHFYHNQNEAIHWSFKARESAALFNMI